MTTVVDPYTFSGGGTALASQINARFAALFTAVNGQLDSSNLASAVQHALLQAGDLKASAVTAAPTGWLLCDGAAYSRTAYVALFGAISTTYGAGDGSSTFNVPDLRGRVAVGKGTHSTVATLSQSEGSALANRTPKHSHLIPSQQMNTGAVGTFGAGDAPASANGPARAGGYTFPWGQQTDGPSDTPAFQVVNWFIYTGQ